MGKVKQEVLKIIRQMPDEATLLDIMAELYLRHKVDEGLRGLDAGEGTPHEQAKERMRKWLD